MEPGRDKSDSLCEANEYSKLALEKGDQGDGLAINCCNDGNCFQVHCWLPSPTCSFHRALYFSIPAMMSGGLSPIFPEFVNQHVVLLSRRVESLLKISREFSWFEPFGVKPCYRWGNGVEFGHIISGGTKICRTSRSHLSARRCNRFKLWTWHGEPFVTDWETSATSDVGFVFVICWNV